MLRIASCGLLVVTLLAAELPSQQRRPLPELVMPASAGHPRPVDSVGATFGQEVELSTGITGGDHIDILDVNGDTHPDIIVSNTVVAGIAPRWSVLLGDGAGGFGSPIVGPATIASGGDVVADVNFDTYPDLVHGARSGLVVLYPGDGTGAFATPTFVGTQGAAHTREVMVSDMNLDGRPDIVTVDAVRTVVYYGDGAGVFPTWDILPYGTDANAALGDVDNNGAPDIVVVDAGSNQIGVMLQTSVGSFSYVPTSAPVGGGSLGGFALGDVDGDGALDAVVSTFGLDIKFTGDGAGGFVGELIQGSMIRTGAVCLTDIDGDGDLDAIIGRLALLTSGEIEVLANDGTGTFTEIERHALASNGYFDTAVADFNKDGRPDIVGIAFEQSDALAVVLNQRGVPTGTVSMGTGTPTCQGTIALGANSVPSVGNVDFALTCTNAPPGQAGIGMLGTADLPGFVVSGLALHLLPTSILLVPLFEPDVSGTGHAPLPIPNEPLFSGLAFSAQVIWIEEWAEGQTCSAANPPWISSNLLEITIQ